MEVEFILMVLWKMNLYLRGQIVASRRHGCVCRGRGGDETSSGSRWRCGINQILGYSNEHVSNLKSQHDAIT